MKTTTGNGCKETVARLSFIVTDGVHFVSEEGATPRPAMEIRSENEE